MRIIAALALLSLVACNPVKKAVKTFDDHPEAAALYCAVKFPIVDTVIIGDTVTHTDTAYQLEFIHDTTTNDTVFRTITRPVTVTRTVYRVDTIIRENTARVTDLQYKYDNTVKALSESVLQHKADVAATAAMKAKRNKWRMWVFILLGAAGMFTFLKLKKIL